MSNAIEPIAQEPARDEAVYEDVRSVIADARSKILVAANSVMVEACWQVGRRIYDEVGDRVAYGKHLLAYLSERLTAEFGKGFDGSSLRRMRRFYRLFPIRAALRPELSWTHYRTLMTCDTQEERDWYMNADGYLDHLPREKDLERVLERNRHEFEQMHETKLIEGQSE